jgi:hypothetical protein
MAATVIIGGKTIEIPVLNFKSIKKIWPLVEKIEDSDNLMQLMDVASDVLAIALERSDQPMTKDDIENNLLGPEIAAIQTSVENLLIESGLLQRTNGGAPGEAVPAAENHSTATGTELSPSLSPPDAVEETGSELKSPTLSPDTTG